MLDNLREGVLKPDVYDPLLNPLYRDVLAHYGAVALPCRVRDPDRKGKVESGIAHTQKALRGLRFESLEDAQAWLDHWDERWADTRIHGTTKRQVAAMFADERPHLRPLPVEPFRYYTFGERVVHLDGFVEVAGAYYAPPPGWIGRTVTCSGTSTTCASSIRRRTRCCASTSSPIAAVTACSSKIDRRARRRSLCAARARARHRSRDRRDRRRDLRRARRARRPPHAGPLRSREEARRRSPSSVPRRSRSTPAR